MIKRKFSTAELREKGNCYAARSFIFHTINRDRLINGKRKILYACIGTPRISGDSFGPMVGSILEKHLADIDGCDSEVIGTVSNPLTALTLEKYRNKLTSDDYFVVAVDAAVSSDTEDSVIIRDGGFEPGIGIGNHNKVKPLRVGDLSCLYVLQMDTEKATNTDVFKKLSNISTSDLEEKAVFLTKAILNAEMDLLGKRRGLNEIYG